MALALLRHLARIGQSRSRELANCPISEAGKGAKSDK